MTFDEVIEEHRRLTGAESVHVTPGPEATPEKLREALALVRRSHSAYEALPERVRLRSRIELLEERLREIRRECQVDLSQLRLTRDVRSQVFTMAEVIGVDEQHAIDNAERLDRDDWI